MPLLTRFSVLFLLSVTAALGQSYTFTDLAGRAPLNATDDGVGSNARFDTPGAACLDPAGNIFIADTNNFTIRRITPAGVVTTFAGLGGVKGSADGVGESARFGQCWAIIADLAGNLIVADFDSHTIRKISPTRVVTTVAGLAATSGSADGTGSTARFNNPVGLAVDSEGTIFVGDRGNRTIRKITAAGVVSTFAGSAGLGGSNDGIGTNARFLAISNLALDPSGNLFVTDNTNHVIRKITPAGVVSTFAGATGISGTTNGVGTAARFNFPNAIVSDPAGNLFVADTNNHGIRKITAEGVVTSFAGASPLSGTNDGTGASARFFRPYGLALDAAGNFYVADTNNHSIRHVTSVGVVSTVAGPGGSFGSSDGVGATARFYYPQSLALDSRGTIYVTDPYNNLVRRVSPAGSVTTVAGAVGAATYVDGAPGVARFPYPFGTAVDSSGIVYLTDLFYNTVRYITASGETRTFAGVPSFTVTGSNDGAAAVARFNGPRGLATDRENNVFVADSGNHTIRKISPNGTVTTVGGLATVRGTADGAASVARFASPSGVAVDAAGTIFVADTGNHTIRVIAADGTVSTLAGTAGTAGSNDGIGTGARFSSPFSVAVDPAGNVFVADSTNATVRKISPAGVVTTIGGTAGITGSVGGTGSRARFLTPSSVAVDFAGALYVIDANANRLVKGVLDSTPAIAAQPQSLAVTPGTRVTFSATAAGGGLAYQWKFNGTLLPGATTSSYTVTGAVASSAGNYTVEVANSAGNATSQPALLTVIDTPNVGRITNLAIRSQAGTGGQTLIVGVGIGGAGTNGPKPVLLRAVGPTLGAFGVPGFLADPKLELFSGATKTNENDDWSGNTQIAAIGGAVGAFALASNASKDAALYNSAFSIGSYSVQVTGGGGTTGVALAEIYDATPPASYGPATPRLINVSARTQVGTGSDLLIAGFTVSGLTSKTVLIRAVGPTLTTFGVPGALADPVLTLFSGSQKIDENDDWGGTPAVASTFFAVGAFPLAASSRDSVLLVTLAPGSYTAQITGANTTTGVALVEVYDVP